MVIEEERPPIPWTSLSAKQAKVEVRIAINEILTEYGYSYAELYNCRHSGTRLALRRRICFFAYFVLSPHMSEGEVAMFIHMKRTGLMGSRRAYVADIKEETAV